MKSELSELQDLLDAFDELNIKEREGPSFMEIAKFPHWENVWSNILAFYMDPNEVHTLYDLVLKSILQAAKISESTTGIGKVLVRTEESTETKKRIDIVVEADRFVLGIENKVNAPLYNKLSDYSTKLDQLAKSGNVTNVYKIVLSKNLTKPTAGFVSVRYVDLIRCIKNNIGDYLEYANSNYLLFLLDFIKNIQKQIDTGGMGDNKEVTDFILKNAESVEKLVRYYNKFQKDLDEVLNHIDRLIDKESIEALAEEHKGNFSGHGPNKAKSRFTWKGVQMIKFTITVNDYTVFYSVRYEDSELVSLQFCTDDSQGAVVLPKLKAKKIDYHTFETTDPEEIAEIATTEMQTIIEVLSKIKNVE